MPAGRPRKPLALKRLQGTVEKSREREITSKSPGLLDLSQKPPADLNTFERLAWNQLAAVIDPLRVATPADAIAFRQMAITLGVIERCRKEIEDAGGSLFYVANSAHGEVYKKRPQVEIIATYQRILDAKLSRFGLTPADREKAGAIPEAPEDDPLDEFD